MTGLIHARVFAKKFIRVQYAGDFLLHPALVALLWILGDNGQRWLVQVMQLCYLINLDCNTFMVYTPGLELRRKLNLFPKALYEILLEVFYDFAGRCHLEFPNECIRRGLLFVIFSSQAVI